MKTPKFIKKIALITALGTAALIGTTQNSNAQNVQSLTQPVRIEVSENLKVRDWYYQAQDDSLEVLINKNLYDKSMGSLKPIPQNNSSILYLPNKNNPSESLPYVNMVQVGSGYGRFQAENTRDLSTTFSSFANNAGMTGEELKDMISLNNKIPENQIQIIQDRNGRILDAVYTGNERRTDVVPHRQINGQTIKNHILWERGAQKIAPLDAVLKVMGYDLNASNIESDNYNNLIQENDDLYQNLDKEQKNNKAKSDTIKQQRTELLQWNVGPILGLNGTRTQNQTILGPEVGVYGTIGRLGIGMIYGLPTNTQLEQLQQETRTNIPSDRPQNKQGILVRNTQQTTNLDLYNIEGILGYRVSDNVTLFGTAGMRQTRNTQTIKDRFWKEQTDIYGNTQILEEKLEHDKIILQKNQDLVIGGGAKINLGGKFNLYGRANIVPRTKDVYGSIGLQYNLRKNQNK